MPRLAIVRSLLYRALTYGAIACGAMHSAATAQAAEPAGMAPIARRLPPQGTPLPQHIDTALQGRLAELQQQASALQGNNLAADVTVLLKAVKFALVHNEFYKPGDEKKAEALLAEAAARIKALNANDPTWTTARGLVVRGFTSEIDGSVQPYGMEIPEKLNLSEPQPLIVWLHGRGDTNTDLHFITDRMRRSGQVAPPWALVLHPFGRQCVGFKNAGEMDVLEAVEHVKQQYKVDNDRIILMGFSMGGAGAWHMGAHYAERWAAVSPGAGFADVARYQRLAPGDYPPSYEQTLWGLNDVPCYVRNLFNLPVVAYSGEDDKQIQAAQLMEQAFEKEGRELTHLIGPGMGHKYHPEVLAEIVSRMKQAAEAGRPALPREVHLQTRTLRYNEMHWVTAVQLEEHWKDSRVDAKLTGNNLVEVNTKNITRLKLSPWDNMAGKRITIDGQSLTAGSAAGDSLVLEKYGKQWQLASADSDSPGLRKQHGLQGPIDDAFRTPFLFVMPSGKSNHAQLEQWVSLECAHQLVRWAALMRGAARVKRAHEVTADDVAKYNLILWGDPSTNRLIGEFLASPEQPLQWDDKQITLAGKSYAAESHVPVMIYPNPANPKRYVVLNSGLTFREAHDRTNSLQNPKLPDWAVLDIATPPTAEAAGKVVAADFFNEAWQVK